MATPVILAHRGAHDPETPGTRENTLDAFRTAADIADGVELDVRSTRDGLLVVHHDRLLAGGGRLADSDAVDLPDWLPTLETALEVCATMRVVNVELKAEPDTDPGVPARVAATLAGRANVLVSSFNLGALDAFHDAAPAIPTGWLTMVGYDQGDAIATAAAHGHQAINPPEAATTPELIATAHAAGLQVVVWTVDEPGRVVELGAAGADVIVTDFPRRAAAALR